MAFDKKRLQTFKWLERIAATRKIAGIDAAMNPYKNQIIYHNGRFYATNSYILVRAEWDELACYRSSSEWQKVLAYMDIEGKLLEYPLLENMERHPNGNLLDNMFFAPNMKNANGDPREFKFTPALVIEALRGFNINRLNPTITLDSTKIQFDAHNDDVSMSALVIGRR